MIGMIRGRLVESAFTEILVDVHGVGYSIDIPISTFDKLPRTGNEVEVFTYMYVREDVLKLFGFATKEEKQLFEILLSVSGVGPKVALNILSAMSVQSFCRAVSNEEVKTIGKLKGLGPKTAQRLVLELKSKVLAVSPESQYGKPVEAGTSQAVEEAALALAQLGFKHDQAMVAVRKIASGMDDKDCTAEKLIKLTLNALNK